MRSRFVLILPVLLLLFLAVLSSLANDSAASTASGGIILKREARISMEKEHLFISENKISVDYDFVSGSDQDITTEVAFPIPPFDFHIDDPGEPRSFDDFKVWVDGQPFDYQVDVKAFLNGVDRTSVFQQLNLKLTNFLSFEYDFMTGKCKSLKLPEGIQGALIQNGLLDENVLCPTWTIHKTYYWTQTFPAHKTIHVRHEYKPVVGFTEFNSRELDQRFSEKERAELVERAKTDKLIDPNYMDSYLKPLGASCVDPALKAKLAHESEEEYPDPAYQDRGGILSFTWVDYILTTANSWKTPIKNFELVVERPPSQTQFPGHISFCWDGKVERLDSTHFLVKAANFVPKKELTVGFVSVMANPKFYKPEK